MADPGIEIAVEEDAGGSRRALDSAVAAATGGESERAPPVSARAPPQAVLRRIALALVEPAVGSSGSGP
jgi:hypothetical protein